MSSKKYASPLRLELKPSVIFFVLLGAIHLLAVALIWKMVFPLSLQILATTLLLFSFYFYALEHALRRSRRAVVALLWDEHDQWCLFNVAGEKIEANLCADSFVHPGLLILNFQIPGRRWRRSVVIPKDAMPRQPLRQLRVRLKLNSQRAKLDFA